jgi:hypothetical protein
VSNTLFTGKVEECEVGDTHSRIKHSFEDQIYKNEAQVAVNTHYQAGEGVETAVDITVRDVAGSRSVAHLRIYLVTINGKLTGLVRVCRIGDQELKADVVGRLSSDLVSFYEQEIPRGEDKWFRKLSKAAQVELKKKWKRLYGYSL